MVRCGKELKRFCPSYGTGGRLVDRQFGESISKGPMKGAIKKPELQKRLTEYIKTIVVEKKLQINNMIIHRDGRWCPSEISALQQTIKKSKEEKNLPENFIKKYCRDCYFKHSGIMTRLSAL
ncbi:MAG: hypothetical protein F6K48_11815 [Okeania sp. SIO3H1]|uniref:hypothetical protein n=1 Tax=Okeania sp. SIO1I7 TaxID=2607772 RepID=UPI0013C5DAF2|nr:hypothetical protein [Okeania sp. SIO1I7]NEN89546.1 hypothetical protein [Okeania sp. SIO3H1]NET26580.1 hypothetical protein [Okeania sp. SIO1I7]